MTVIDFTQVELGASQIMIIICLVTLRYAGSRPQRASEGLIPRSSTRAKFSTAPFGLIFLVLNCVYFYGAKYV
jgi:hypothetical protein